MKEKKYVYSKEREILHSIECVYAKRINEENKLYSSKATLMWHRPLCMHCTSQMFKTALSVEEGEEFARLFENPKNSELWFELLINREAEVEKGKGKLRITCGEDRWQMIPIKNSKYVYLLHNNYIVAGDIRYFESGYH